MVNALAATRPDVSDVSGFRITEVGDLPNDWQAVALGTLGIFSKGQGVRKDQSKTGDLPCVRYGELYTDHDNIIRDFRSHISPEIAASSKRLRTGDVLFAGSGETKAEIGKCAAFIDSFEAYAGGDIVILSPKQVNSQFLGYALNAPLVAKQKAKRGQGDAVVHISAHALSSILVPLPSSESEQAAIAEALSDADALIESLEQLIAKKRAIKQGAMQELLTGKRRLDGFQTCSEFKKSEIGEIPEDWQIVSIADIGSVGRGRVISHKEISRSKDPKYPVYSSQTSNSGIMGYLDGYEFDGKYITWTTDGANAGTVFFRDGKFNCTNVCGTIRIEKQIPEFIALILSRFAPSHVSRHLGNPKLMNDVMKRVQIPLPTKTEEQQAIFEVISNMESEIYGLSSKLAKAQQFKTGMMQELLTGRTRLV